jgi:hypothetical protein
LLHAALPHVPLWLDEGLAEYFEMPPAERADGHPYQAGMVWHLRLGLLPALADLERKDDLADMGRNEYRASWAWVHFMLHGPPEARAALAEYLIDLRQGESAAPISRRLVATLPNAERRLGEHFLRWPQRHP